MHAGDLEGIYRKYIKCLNERDWETLGLLLHEDVTRNGSTLGIKGYTEMVEEDYEEIPDLHFEVDMLVVQPPTVACRLRFDVTPKGTFLGLAVNGRRVTFCENVFYIFEDEKIRDVMSVIDKIAIEFQLLRSMEASSKSS